MDKRFRAQEASQEKESGSGTPPGVQILSFICGLVFAVLAAKSAHQDILHIHKLTSLDSFTETPGRFLHVKVRQDSSGSMGDFYPDVLYEYFVEGHSLWGWRLSYEDEPKSRDVWEKRLSGYAAGDTVPVFYNPREPKDSLLEKKHGGVYRTAMKLGLGLLFLAAGLVLSVVPVSNWLRRNPG